jgi:catechol 2,3-dioxygenase-like lactoylglutathione lyase family enzyme
MITVTGVDHINMNVKSLEASRKFYGETFGFEVKESGARGGTPWAILGLKDRVYLCLYEVGDAKKTGQDLQINHFGFHVEDFDAVEAKLRALGVPLSDGSFVDYGASRSIYVDDPSGHEIELSEVLGGGLR